MSYRKFFDIHPFNEAVDLAFKSAQIKVDKVIHGSNMLTYKYWLMGKDKYHYFGNYKVYYSYKWSVAEDLDKKGFIHGAVNPLKATAEDIVYSNYADRYKKL